MRKWGTESGKLLGPMKISPLRKKKQTEMVWAHNKINRNYKDDGCYRALYKEGEGKVDRNRDGKTT